jgi:hypothetical protein
MKHATGWLWLLLAVETALLGALTPFGDFTQSGNPVAFVCLFLLAGCVYLAAMRVAAKTETPMTLSLFWTGAIVLRLVALTNVPGDDIWRYLWEGEIQWHGFNPYLQGPLDAQLQPLHDAVWAQVGHKEWRAIYPPAAETMFAGLTAISINAVWFKAVFGLADLLVIPLLLRLNGGDLRQTLWFAWNPALAWAFAGSGRFDSCLLLAMTAAILALDRSEREKSISWPFLASVFLGVAIALKAIPIFWLPLFAFALGRRCWLLAVAVAIPALWCLPYGGIDAVTKVLRNFALRSRYDDLFWWIVEGGRGVSAAQNKPYNLVILGATLVLSFLFRRDWRRGLLWVTGAILILSPTLHPWYVAWILPLACWRRMEPWFVLSLSVMCALLLWQSGPVWQAWNTNWFIRTLVIVPPLLALALGAWQKKYHLKNHELAHG